jgi:hypothetical protein
MKHYLIAFFAVITIFSCNKDMDNNTPSEGRLIEQRTGNEYVKLQYDNNGKVSKAIVLNEDFTNGEEVTYNISYNAIGRISEVTNTNGELIRTEYENDRLSKAIMLIGNEETGSTEYHYENGLLKEAQVKFKLFELEMITMKFRFTYDGQQRVKQSDLWMLNPITGELEPGGYTVFEFDSHKNPLYDLNDFLLLMWEVPAVNNVIKETQYHTDNTIDEVREFYFTYNAQQYPVEGIMRTKINGQQMDTNLKFKYH